MYFKAFFANISLINIVQFVQIYILYQRDFVNLSRSINQGIIVGSQPVKFT
jgi:hypothetical protein